MLISTMNTQIHEKYNSNLKFWLLQEKTNIFM